MRFALVLSSLVSLISTAALSQETASKTRLEAQVKHSMAQAHSSQNISTVSGNAVKLGHSNLYTIGTGAQFGVTRGINNWLDVGSSLGYVKYNFLPKSKLEVASLNVFSRFNYLNEEKIKAYVGLGLAANRLAYDIRAGQGARYDASVFHLVNYEVTTGWTLPVGNFDFVFEYKYSDTAIRSNANNKFITTGVTETIKSKSNTLTMHDLALTAGMSL